MTNVELESRLLELVHSERRITVEILGLLQLAQERKLYLEQGYPTLFDWLVRKFGYSEGSAYRRIQAARLVKEVPGAADKIVEGRLTVSALAKAQAAIRLQEKSGNMVNKAAVVDLVTDCNLRKTEESLARHFPGAPEPRREQIQIANATQARLHITISRVTLSNLKDIRERWSHRLPHATLATVIQFLAHDFLQTQCDSLGVSRSVRAQVLRRDQRRCQYQDPVTGRFCHSRYQIEIDHIQPKALGGQDTLENLRCLCRAHNQHRAEKTFGRPYDRRRGGPASASEAAPAPTPTPDPNPNDKT